MLCEERNIIHRDIKPDNIMISQFGDYELGDFGQAKIMDHTTMGTATGTPGFLGTRGNELPKIWQRGRYLFPWHGFIYSFK